MHISVRADYAIRAMLAIAAADPGRVTAAQLAQHEQMSIGSLQTVLLELRRVGLVLSHRGTERGYGLARPASAITVGEILRAMNGALTTVRGLPTGQATYDGVGRGLRRVWLSVDTAVNAIVDQATLADLLAEDRTEERTEEHVRHRTTPI
ncbi:Rrf2 family transcriptional regulator [Dactylosporangium aurantiacum]|uniref:Rrf2 family transcriptional regulator n=1 Tax=Dactylosporangium aurantiacum TaxID=35754 RepID=A0A9Q9MB09_9ACTN|nr:Rrf2 family transcriptional regulator [Dactylosporangium aurantiacum]MDG6101774.1 Rrf2 family transcriptional regulator [Dactylosporangium aurantiacum]UWZ52418.1 Rrf2 family transcriptional regulator [Dactylosporangium aurantiacum]